MDLRQLPLIKNRHTHQWRHLLVSSTWRVSDILEQVHAYAFFDAKFDYKVAVCLVLTMERPGEHPQ